MEFKQSTIVDLQFHVAVIIEILIILSPRHQNKLLFVQPVNPKCTTAICPIFNA